MISSWSSDFLWLNIMYKRERKYILLKKSDIKSSSHLHGEIKVLFGIYDCSSPLLMKNSKESIKELNPYIKSGSYKLYVPPWLSCTCWAIADFSTEEVLMSKNIDYECQPASLTKILTLYCVLRYYNSNEEKMKKEIVKVSKRSAECKGGTHADLQYCDELSVYDLLYALMLPSGNDAAISLAEHIGSKMLYSRIESREKSEDLNECYKEFIKLMNETVHRLGLKHSHFENAHGMRKIENKTSVSDLLTLTFHCLNFELFRKVTSTKKYVCSIKGRNRNRKKEYKNSHSLLGMNGFKYGKTGWVPDGNHGIHGNLWSVVERNGKMINVIVLGSIDQNMRFVDSRVIVDWCYSVLED